MAVDSERHSPEKAFATQRRDYALFILLVLVGALGPWEVSDTIDLAPLHLLVAIYLGYRMGRWFGAVGGLVMLSVAYLSNHVEVLYDFLENEIDGVYEASFQELVFAGILGWLSGWLIDWLERRLAAADIRIADHLLRDRAPILGSWYGRLQKSLVESSTSKDGEPLAAWLQPKLLSYGRRAKWIVAVPLILILLNLNILVILDDLPWGWIAVEFPPLWTAASLLVLMAFITGNRQVIGLALLMWLAGVIILIALTGEITEWWIDSAQVGFAILQPAQIVGLIILIWLAARIGKAWQRPEIRTFIGQLLAPHLRPPGVRPPATLTLFLIAIPFCISVNFSVSFDFLSIAAAAQIAEISVDRPYMWDNVLWQPFLALFTCLLFLGWFRDATGVSNRALFLLLILALLGAEFSGWEVQFALLHLSATQVLLLVAAPKIGERLDLTRLATCRLAIFGFFVATSLTSIYFGGTMPTDVTIPNQLLLSLAFQLALAEILSRILHRLALRTQGNIGPLPGRLKT